METNTPQTEVSTIKKKRNTYQTDQELLQKIGILFENINKQPELKATLAEYSYDEQELEKGKELYDKALEAYQHNIKETQEETLAQHLFRKKLEDFTSVFSTDRKKAKIVFRNQEDSIINLRLRGRIPQNMSGVLDDTRVFYGTLDKNDELLQAISRLKVDKEHIANQLKSLDEVEKAYANYTKEKGESQQATKDKNKAIKEAELWVKECYAVAKIALEDKPQLLESLGKMVKG